MNEAIVRAGEWRQQGGGEIRLACLLTGPHVLMACLLFSPFLTSSPYRRTRAWTARNYATKQHSQMVRGKKKNPVLITAQFRGSFTPSGSVCWQLMLWTLSVCLHFELNSVLCFSGLRHHLVSDRLQCCSCTPEVIIVQQSCWSEWVITMWRGLSPETGLVFLLLV